MEPSIGDARLALRCKAASGKPWDLILRPSYLTTPDVPTLAMGCETAPKVQKRSGLPGSGREVAVPRLTQYQIVDGKIAAMWIQLHKLALQGPA
jgi:hypothetical protein